MPMACLSMQLPTPHMTPVAHTSTREAACLLWHILSWEPPLENLRFFSAQGLQAC